MSSGEEKLPMVQMSSQGRRTIIHVGTILATDSKSDDSKLDKMVIESCHKIMNK